MFERRGHLASHQIWNNGAKESASAIGVNPGGFVGFFNPETGDHETFSAKGDVKAKRRMEIKLRAKAARRAIRYQRFGAKKVSPAKKAA
jgi:hypothetical protein